MLQQRQELRPWLVHAEEGEESEGESDTDGEGEEGEEGDTERREWESGGWTEIVPERDKG